MAAQWFGRLSYLVHEIDDALRELKATAQDPHVQRELRLCGCSERLALINSVLLEADAVAQLCQVCGEFLLGIAAQSNAQSVKEAGAALTIIMEVAFLKVKWTHQLCLAGHGAFLSLVQFVPRPKYCCPSHRQRQDAACSCGCVDGSQTNPAGFSV